MANSLEKPLRSGFRRQCLLEGRTIVEADITTVRIQIKMGVVVDHSKIRVVEVPAIVEADLKSHLAAVSEAVDLTRPRPRRWIPTITVEAAKLVDPVAAWEIARTRK